MNEILQNTSAEAWFALVAINDGDVVGIGTSVETGQRVLMIHLRDETRNEFQAIKPETLDELERLNFVEHVEASADDPDEFRQYLVGQLQIEQITERLNVRQPIKISERGKYWLQRYRKWNVTRIKRITDLKHREHDRAGGAVSARIAFVDFADIPMHKIHRPAIEILPDGSVPPVIQTADDYLKAFTKIVEEMEQRKNASR